MRRMILLALTTITLLPAGGCVRLCSDSAGVVTGRNWIPFTRKYTHCNGRHCVDRAGAHLDARCRCSDSCSCWGHDVAKADADGTPGATDGTGTTAPATSCGACGCGG